MSSRHRTVNSQSGTLSENENDEYNKQTENNTVLPQGETSVEPNANATENIQENPLKIPESSFCEMLTGQIQNPSTQLQQQFSEVLSSEQTQPENERLLLKD